MSKVKAIPDGFHTITPHLIVRDSKAAIDFYQKAFGAQLQGGIAYAPDGKVMHAMVKIGDSLLMLNDEFPAQGVVAPKAGESGIALHIYVDNVDELFGRATRAGAQAKMPPADMFWGDRYGKVQDPFGHTWTMATHIKDMTQDEMKAAMDEAMSAMRKTA
ncbi:MAG TPA: VOC family protein [Terriglobales bacterium]